MAEEDLDPEGMGANNLEWNARGGRPGWNPGVGPKGPRRVRLSGTPPS